MRYAAAYLGEALHFNTKRREFESRWSYWKYSLTNFSDGTEVLGSTQPLTQMSARDISLGITATVCVADIFTTYMCQRVGNLEDSKCWNPQILSASVMV